MVDASDVISAGVGGGDDGDGGGELLSLFVLVVGIVVVF